MKYRTHYYRAAFFLFCIAPTVYTIGWLVERQFNEVTAASADPRFLPSVEREFSRMLGVSVTLGSVDQQPTETRLTGVELHDPETGTLLATADSVRMTLAKGGVLAIEPAGVSVQADQLSRLAEILHVTVLRSMSAELTVDAGCPSVQLIGGPREETLADVNLSIKHEPQGRVATLDFKPAWDAQREPLTLEIARTKTETGLATSLSFATGEKPLPATWFDFCLPEFSKLGDTCSVQGTLAARETDFGWESEFRGKLHQVELDRVVASRLRKHPLGTANVDVDHAHWLGGKLVEASGLIEASNLKLNWATMLEAAPIFHLQDQHGVLRPDSLRNGLLVAQGLLVCRFSIRPDALVIIGQEESILWDGPQRLYAPPGTPLPWSKPLLSLCRELGMPPLESIPEGFDIEPPTGVRLNRG